MIKHLTAPPEWDHSAAATVARLSGLCLPRARRLILFGAVWWKERPELPKSVRLLDPAQPVGAGAYLRVYLCPKPFKAAELVDWAAAVHDNTFKDFLVRHPDARISTVVT